MIIKRSESSHVTCKMVNIGYVCRGAVWHNSILLFTYGTHTHIDTSATAGDTAVVV